MSTSTTSNKLFTLVSCVSLAGGVIAFAPSAMAACPEPDPGALPYVGANAPKKACTAADIALFKTEVAKPNSTFVSIETAVTAQNAACGACIFTAEDDAGWGPIVYVGDAGGAFANYGSCFEKGAGGNAACGGAIQKYDLCTQVRCPDGPGYCTDKNASDTCVDTVSNDTASCGKYDYFTACPNLQTLASTTCKNLYAVIGVMCGGVETPDAGTPDLDAGTPHKVDAGSKADSGTTKKDAGKGSSSSGSSSGDDDENTEEEDASVSGTSSSGTSGGKKGSGTSSGAANNAEEDIVPTDSAGCAQTGSGTGGSIASALVLAGVVGAAASRRRRPAKR